MVPEFHPPLSSNVLFCRVFLNLTLFMTKLRILVLSFPYFTDISNGDILKQFIKPTQIACFWALLPVVIMDQVTLSSAVLSLLKLFFSKRVLEITYSSSYLHYHLLVCNRSSDILLSSWQANAMKNCSRWTNIAVTKINMQHEGDDQQYCAFTNLVMSIMSWILQILCDFVEEDIAELVQSSETR